MTKILINPGHGGKDNGASGNGLNEKDLTLKIGRKIVKGLEAYKNVNTRLYRNDDSFKSLKNIADEANNWGADYFVSVHINNGGGKDFESYIWNGGVSDQTKDFRGTVHDAILDHADVGNRGKKTANFAVLRNTTMPAILTENLFIDNESEAKQLNDDSFIEKLADAHVKGIVQAIDVKEKTKSDENTDLPSGTLQAGQEGKKVKHLQNALNKLNFKVGDADGIYGEKTKDGVTRFQKVHDPKNVDGIYGSRTRKRMKKQL